MSLSWGRGAFSLLFVLQAHTEQDGCKYLHIPPQPQAFGSLSQHLQLSLEPMGAKAICGQSHLTFLG